PITVVPATPVLYGGDDPAKIDIVQENNKPTYTYTKGTTIVSGTPLGDIKLAKARTKNGETRYGYVIGDPASTEPATGSYRWGYLEDGDPTKPKYLDGGLEEDGTTAPNLTVHVADNGTPYTYLFIPADRTNLCIVQGTLDITADKANLVVASDKTITATDIMFGQKLSNSTITIDPGFISGVEDIEGNDVVEWVDPDFIPTKVGVTTCYVRYIVKTPAGVDNPEFNAKSDIAVKVNVTKAKLYFDNLKVGILTGNTFEAVESVVFGDEIGRYTLKWDKVYYYDEGVDADGNAYANGKHEIDNDLLPQVLSVSWEEADREINNNNFDQDPSVLNGYLFPIRIELSDEASEYFSDEIEDITIVVQKIAVESAVAEWDYAPLETVSFGTPLSAISLPTDETLAMWAEVYDSVTNKNISVRVNGTFAWVDDTIYPGMPELTKIEDGVLKSNHPAVAVDRDGRIYYYAIFTPDPDRYENYSDVKFGFSVNVKKASGKNEIGFSKTPEYGGAIADKPLRNVTLNIEGVVTYVYGFKAVTVESQDDLLNTPHYIRNEDGSFTRTTTYQANVKYFVTENIEIPGTIGWEDADRLVNNNNRIYNILFKPDSTYSTVVDDYKRAVQLLVYTSSSCFSFDVVEGNAVITGLKPDHTGCGGHEILVIQDTIEDDRGTFTVVGIGDAAFRGNVEIKSVELPATVSTIGVEAFSGCTTLTEINLPIDLDEICDKAFMGCNSLATVRADGQYYKKIGDFAFQDCIKLTAINIPASVTKIGKGAFLNCKDLTSVTIAQNNEMYRLSDDGCVILEKDGEGVYSFLHTYFASNAALNYVIDEDVKTIGAYAFAYNTTLVGKVIAKNVIAIQDHAFAFSPSLSYAYFMLDLIDFVEPDDDQYTIFENNDHLIVYGPEGSVYVRDYCADAHIEFKEQTFVRYLGIVQLNGTSYKTTVDSDGNATINSFAE
ncbi:MAG: leucine-rich repeat domain-containing protein, partial [Clostridia bacterium]|nr:leucine-rich repeat domain-containing protein [Clostridia bacterium]